MRYLVPAVFLLIQPIQVLSAAQIENPFLRVDYDARQPASPLALKSKVADASLLLQATAPVLEFEGGVTGPVQPDNIELKEQDDLKCLVLAYPSQPVGEAQVQARVVFEVSTVSPVLRKRVEFSATGPAAASLLLKRVILLDEPFAEPIEFQMTGWQSYPVFGQQFFLGVEFPVAQAAAADNRIRLSHAPGATLTLPAEFRSHDAVIGVCPKGRARQAFEEYVSSFRPIADRVHFNYNSWWTSPMPFSEADILQLISVFDEKLYRAHGASFDTFTIDMGWSDPNGIWKISPKLFPNGFTALTAALARQQSQLGLWWSPSNCYSPSSFDNDWASLQGYETMSIPRRGLPPLVLPCLGRGTRYQRETAENLSRIARDFGLGQMKFDGYHPSCTVNAHGHQPGELSAEAIAAGLIEILKSLQQVNPQLWMETTCFGFDASPWWLKHATSVIGPFGDDAPYGAVPAPVYRESYTTSRDFYNLHGSVTPVPIAAQEVLGIIHQSAEPMYNDAVTTVLRGHQFISLYLNPKFMADRDYRFLAELMAWTRANASMLARTRVIWPEAWKKNGPAPFGNLKDMPRESYGYGHWRDGQGLVCVRNPWIEMDEVPLVLDEATLGMPEGTQGPLAAVQIYPRRSCLAKGLMPGGRLNLRMRPYETKVIRLVPDRTELKLAEDRAPDPSGLASIRKAASLRIESRTISPETQPLGDDYTVVSNPETTLWQARIEGTSESGGTHLYWLVESPEPPGWPRKPDLTVNGRPASAERIDSEVGWSAAQRPGKQNSWIWHVVPLPAGEWTAAACIEASADSTVSAWVLSEHSVETPADAAVELAAGTPPLPLPPDARVSVSVQAIGLTAIKDLPVEQRTEPARVQRVRGIYLDRLEPASASQGWGELRRNQSVWERPICIGTQRFARGLGTHAHSRIVYKLEGRYKAIHGFGGQDAAAGGSITMEIQVDGKPVWQSGRLTRGDEPKPFSIPLSGANELTLNVSDGGDSYMGDHADWADVWLESE